MSEQAKDHSEAAISLNVHYIAGLIPDLRHAAELLHAVDYMGTIDVINGLQTYISQLEDTLVKNGFSELAYQPEENVVGGKVIYPTMRPQDGRF